MSVRQRGSALVFVLIIIAGIVTVTIGTQRLSLVQFNQATREEDNTFALYAAKSGVEDGLLRFRYERDVETVVDRVHRFNVTDGLSYGEVDRTRPISSEADFSPTDQYYDLAIDFKTDRIGDFATMTQSPTLEQDKEIELTGFPNNQDNYYLRFAFRWEDITACRAKGAFVQFQQATTPATGDSLFNQKVVRTPGTGDVVDSRSTNENILLSSSTGLASVLRLRAYHCPVQYAFTTTYSNNGESGGPEFDSLTTKISATGYFGEAKRTLEATVDRKSGRLISIYDFNLYSGQTCIGTDLAFLDLRKCD